MKRLEKIYAYSLLLIFAGIVVHAPLSVGLGTLLPHYALLIKSWKEIIMLLLVPVAITLVSRRKLWHEFGCDWLFRLLIAYAVLHLLIMGIWWHGVATTAAGLAIDLRYILFFALVYTLMRIAPRYKKTMLKIGIIGALIVVGFAVMQLFLPADILSHIGYNDHTIQPYLTVDKNPNFIRVNSTLRGPNPLGAYAASVLIMLVAFVFMQKSKLRNQKTLLLICLLAAASVIALWISYSRSSEIAALIGIAVVVAATRLKKIPRAVWWVSGLVVLALLAGLYAERHSSFESNVLLHENPGGGSSVKSDQGHVQSLIAGLSDVIHQPLGAGIGSTGSASLLGSHGVIIEDQYLFIAHEVGWVGLALYVGIFLGILYRLWRQRKNWLALGIFASGICLAVIGTVLPVWVDDTVSIVWWGFAAIAIIEEKFHGRQSTK